MSKVLTLKRWYAIVAPSFLIFVAALFICPLIGSDSIDLGRALDFSVPMSDNADALILFYARLPRCLLAALVGAGLAAAGVSFQAMLKNPLATPYTLGIAGGGALASTLVIFIIGSATLLTSRLLQPAASLLGALATLWLVYRLAARKGVIQPVSMILAGVTLNLIFSAVILLIQFISDPARSFFILRWLMGNLDVMDYTPVLILLPLQLIGLGILFYHARDMNLLVLDEMSARSLGLNYDRVMKTLYAAGSLVAGTAIAFSGPIGFVGLIIPHAVRLAVGADHRALLPASLFLGGAFLVICDTAARTVIAPTELPVGVITALSGGPFFLWLLMKRKY